MCAVTDFFFWFVHLFSVWDKWDSEKKKKTSPKGICVGRAVSSFWFRWHVKQYIPGGRNTSARLPICLLTRLLLPSFFSGKQQWRDGPARQHKPASNTERTACLPHFLLRDLVWSYSCLGYYSSSAKPGEALTEKVERKGQFLTGLGCQMLWKLCVVHLFISWSSSEDVSMIAAQSCNSFVS